MGLARETTLLCITRVFTFHGSFLLTGDWWRGGTIVSRCSGSWLDILLFLKCFIFLYIWAFFLTLYYIELLVDGIPSGSWWGIIVSFVEEHRRSLHPDVFSFEPFGMLFLVCR